MQFCTNCGKQLQNGNVCECKLPQQTQQAQPMQPQYPPNQYPNQQYPQQGQYPPPQYPNQQFPPPNQYPHNPYQQQNPYGAPVGKLPGQTMIRVAGIISTIVGGLMLIGYASIINDLEQYNIFGVSLIPQGYQDYLGYAVLMAIGIIVIGILGIVFAAKQGKSTAVIACGIVFAALLGINIIWALSEFGEYLETSNILVELIAFVLPILYIMGGSKRKSSGY
jgi:hypothetical protein